MCPIYRNTFYEWYIAGLDGAFKNVFPSVLATWAPMEYAAKNGLKYFNFMGAGKPDTDYGVREFKSKFGGKEVEYGRYLFINKPILYKVGKLGVHFVRNIHIVSGHGIIELFFGHQERTIKLPAFLGPYEPDSGRKDNTWLAGDIK